MTDTAYEEPGPQLGELGRQKRLTEAAIVLEGLEQAGLQGFAYEYISTLVQELYAGVSVPVAVSYALARGSF